MEKVFLAGVNMGYGHLRAVYPFINKLSDNLIILSENDNSTEKEKKLWNLTLKSYEFLSRSQEYGFIGKSLFKFLNYLTKIPPYYPHRDLSKSVYQVKTLYNLYKKGACEGFLKTIAKAPHIPVLTSFYAPAIAVSEYAKNEVYCIICDSDINRVWVPKNPKKNRIYYFTPCTLATKRLIEYGIEAKNIIETGFPLPEEITKEKDDNFIEQQISKRLYNLKPKHKKNNTKYSPINPERPLSIAFAVGGAGAQKKIGEKIAKSLKNKLKRGEIILYLIAGIRREVYEHFNKLKEEINSDNIQVIYSQSFSEYYKIFNEILNKTDILWTKPSELSFYTAAGIPIIAAPPIGYQEIYNLNWLSKTGTCIYQENPEYCNEWLFDYLEDGIFYRCLLNTLLLTDNAFATYKICSYF